MLTKKDREEIRAIMREVVREELKAALVRTVQVERGPEKQGDPEKVVKEEEWSFVDFWFGYAPKIEGALRGSQETVDHLKNSTAGQNEKLDAIGRALAGMERPMIKIAEASEGMVVLPAEQRRAIGGRGDNS